MTETVTETVTEAVAGSSAKSDSRSPRLKLRLIEARAKDNLLRQKSAERKNADGSATPAAEEACAQHHS